MALEVRYIPMKDEGDGDMPKIFRVVYQDDTAISYSVAPFSEAKAADPSCVEKYFDLVSTYFSDLSTYFDTLTDFTSDATMKMLKIMSFCAMYIEANPESFTVK